MSIFDDIRRDREAGTPGPVFIQDEFLNLFALSDGNSGQTIHLAKINSLQLEHTGDPNGEALANLHRFARVPELERIALAAEALMKAVQEMRNGPRGVSLEVHEAASPLNHLLEEIDATR